MDLVRMQRLLLPPGFSDRIWKLASLSLLWSCDSLSPETRIASIFPALLVSYTYDSEVRRVFLEQAVKSLPPDSPELNAIQDYCRELPASMSIDNMRSAVLFVITAMLLSRRTLALLKASEMDIKLTEIEKRILNHLVKGNSDLVQDRIKTRKLIVKIVLQMPKDIQQRVKDLYLAIKSITTAGTDDQN